MTSPPAWLLTHMPAADCASSCGSTFCLCDGGLLQCKLVLSHGADRLLELIAHLEARAAAAPKDARGRAAEVGGRQGGRRGRKIGGLHFTRTGIPSWRQRTLSLSHSLGVWAAPDGGGSGRAVYRAQGQGN